MGIDLDPKDIALPAGDDDDLAPLGEGDEFNSSRLSFQSKPDDLEAGQPAKLESDTVPEISDYGDPAPLGLDKSKAKATLDDDGPAPLGLDKGKAKATLDDGGSAPLGLDKGKAKESPEDQVKPQTPHDKEIMAMERIVSSLAGKSSPSADRLSTFLSNDISDMRASKDVKNPDEYAKAREAADRHAGQVQSSDLANEAHEVGNKTAKWIGLAAIPGLLALIPSSIIAANNQTDRNKTVDGDNNG